MQQTKELRELAAEVQSAGSGWPEGPDRRNIDRGNIVVEGHTWEAARKLAALVIEHIQEPCAVCDGTKQVALAGIRDQLDKTANALCSVSGFLMHVATSNGRVAREPDEHDAGCDCRCCEAFQATQQATTDLAAIVKQIDNIR